MFEWDKSKATKNKSKHGIAFADTFAVFDDPNAITLEEFIQGVTASCHHRYGCVRPCTGGRLYMAR